MSMQPAKLTTVHQFTVLLEDLAKKPEMVKRGNMNKKQWDDEWDCISRKLNACGPPIRGRAEWKKVWADLRFRAKKKLAENSLDMNFIEKEAERVVALAAKARLDNEIVPDPLAVQPVKGMHKPPPHSHFVSLPDASPPLSPESDLSQNTPPPKRRKLQDEFLTNLQEQVETQREFLEKLEKLDNISTSLESMANSMQTMERSLERLSKGFEQITSFATLCGMKSMMEKITQKKK